MYATHPGATPPQEPRTRESSMPVTKTSAAAAHQSPSWLPQHLPTISSSRIFAGLDGEEIAKALPCLDARLHSFGEGEYVLREGETTTQVYVLLEGGVNVIREDWWGNRNIITTVAPGGTFAESYACTEGTPLAVSAVTTRASTLLTLKARKIMVGCSSGCPYHVRLTQNLVGDVAQHNLALNSKLTYLSQRSTREKLLAYLSDESRRAASPTFTIPFNRQQLADFLSVNRSAMSNELCKMRGEGFTLRESPHS